MHPLPAAGVELPLHRVAEVGGDPPEVGPAFRIGGHAPPVILDLDERPAAVAAADDSHAPGSGVDAVLDELADRLEGVRLRVRDDRDGVPLVADLQRAGGGGVCAGSHGNQCRQF